MDRNKLYKLLLLLFILTSCYKEVEIEFPKPVIKPVVNSWLVQNDSYSLHLSFTKSATDKQVQYIETATVHIEAEDKSYFLTHDKDGFYSSPEFFPTTGVNYNLRVEIDGYPNLLGADSIPPYTLMVNHVKYLENCFIDGEGDEYSEIWINLTDIHPGRNYFGISIAGKDEWGQYFLGIASDSPEILSENTADIYASILVFTDELFQGQRTTIKLNTYGIGAYQVKLYCLSEEAFKYIKTLRIHDYTKEYDFWEVYEPLPLYSNIENGYGIFAGYSSETYPVYPDSTLIVEQQ